MQQKPAEVPTAVKNVFETDPKSHYLFSWGKLGDIKAGILETYLRKPIDVREIDCWANGSRVCRFEGKVRNE